MVSFSCEVCNDTVVKKRLGQHQQRCNGSYFTCIDCNTTFYNNEHNAHTSCITEAQKYEKSLYKPKKKQANVEKPQVKKQESKPALKEEPIPEKKEKKEKKEKVEKKEKKDKKDKKDKKSSHKIHDLLKVNKPTSLKKALKSLSKSEQKEMMKMLKVTKTSDNTITLHF